VAPWPRPFTIPSSQGASRGLQKGFGRKPLFPAIPSSFTCVSAFVLASAFLSADEIAPTQSRRNSDAALENYFERNSASRKAFLPIGNGIAAARIWLDRRCRYDGGGKPTQKGLAEDGFLSEAFLQRGLRLGEDGIV